MIELALSVHSGAKSPTWTLGVEEEANFRELLSAVQASPLLEGERAYGMGSICAFMHDTPESECNLAAYFRRRLVFVYDKSGKPSVYKDLHGKILSTLLLYIWSAVYDGRLSKAAWLKSNGWEADSNA